jgi:NAD(P)-dependent dehydrogenase (short-subunit alcohol dehydrogenase family)
MTDKRSVFITGASGGFGKDTAIGLAERGHTFSATLLGVEEKNEEADQELEGPVGENRWSLRVLDLEVGDDVSVATAAEAAMETAGQFGDPREVADAMMSLAEAPKDQRPLRVPVGADGAAAVNEVSSQVQKGVLEWMKIS